MVRPGEDTEVVRRGQTEMMCSKNASGRNEQKFSNTCILVFYSLMHISTFRNIYMYTILYAVSLFYFNDVSPCEKLNVYSIDAIMFLLSL